MPEEVHGSGSWSISIGENGELVVERIYWEPWSTHVALVGSTLGQPDPVFTNARCVSAEVTPLGSITGSPATYHTAQIKLTYRAKTSIPAADSPLPGNPTLPSGGAELTFNVRATREAILHSVHGMRYGDNLSGSITGPIPTDEAQGRQLVSIEEWTIRVSNLVAPNYSNLNSLKGCVNNATFLGHAVDTVLFVGYDVDIEWRYDSGSWTRRYAVTWHFRVREATRKNSDNTTTTVGWNHVYRNGDWVYIYVNQHELLYPRKSFANIFV